MAIKYECPKCGRRFADWGAEKLGFKCPMDDSCPPDQRAGDSAEEIELVRLGSQDDQLTPRRATTKRVQKRAVDVKPLENQDPEIEDDAVDDVFEADDIGDDADDLDEAGDDDAVPFDEDAGDDDTIDEDGSPDDADTGDAELEDDDRP